MIYSIARPPSIVLLIQPDFRKPAASMAKENGTPTAADKGKGKMEDGKKPDETKKDKDGKPTVNGKKGDEPQDGMKGILQLGYQHADSGSSI